MSHSVPSSPAITTLQCENIPKITKCCNKSQLEECLWAHDYPELQKACFLARICPEKPPALCQYLNIDGILQVGPTCGLTALSMMLGGVPTPRQLLQDAHRKHYTNNGEMFSAQNLFQLICDHLSAPILHNTTNANNIDTECNRRNKIECQMHEGRLNCAKVKENLMQGCCLFVP